MFDSCPLLFYGTCKKFDIDFWYFTVVFFIYPSTNKNSINHDGHSHPWPNHPLSSAITWANAANTLAVPSIAPNPWIFSDEFSHPAKSNSIEREFCKKFDGDLTIFDSWQLFTACVAILQTWLLWRIASLLIISSCSCLEAWLGRSHGQFDSWAKVFMG